MNIVSNINQQQIRLNNINQTAPVRKNITGYSSVSFGSATAKSDKMVKLLDHAIDSVVYSDGINIGNKMKFHKILKAALPSILQPENYLNCGRDSKVYRISDKYVAKVKRGHYEKNSVNFWNATHVPGRRFRDLDFYYGEPVAKVGHVEILKNATPDGKNIFCGTKFNSKSYPNTSSLEKYETEYLPLCSSLPQESFDNFARNLSKLNRIKPKNYGKKGYYPDIENPNNIIISEGQFKLVDKIDATEHENPNSIMTMLEPLLIRYTPFHEARYKESLVGMRKEILRKTYIAAEKAHLPLESPTEYQYGKWTIGELVPKGDITSELENMRCGDIPLEERINFINSALKGK